jgi:PAS domain S-box-containing protein
MSDSSAGPVPSPSRSEWHQALPATQHPRPIAMLVLDAATGRIAASNPAGRRRLTGPTGTRLGDWLARLATAEDHREVTLVQFWTPDRDRAGDRADNRDAHAETTMVRTTPIEFRRRPCLLVALQDDAPAGPGGAPSPAADPGCAVFTLDPVGRIDSWGPTAQRLTGFRAEHVIGSDTGLLHPATARRNGEPHRALTHAYRTGEHVAHGWRACSDGRMIWAEATTCALHDGMDRLVGFAAVVRDLHPDRRPLQCPDGELTIDLRSPRFPAPRRSGASGRSNAGAGTGIRPDRRLSSIVQIPAPRKMADG